MMLRYLLEIKNRLLLLFLTWFSIILIIYLNKETVLFNVIQKNSLKTNNKQLEIFYFIFTNVTEIFSVYLQLITFLNLQTICIYFIYHFFIFIIPALFKSEYSYLKWIIQVASLNYLISIILANFFLFPMAWWFFLSFQELTINNSFNLHFEAKLIEYLNFYIVFYYTCVFYCQIFTLLFLFFNYIDINKKDIKKFRKLSFFYFFILSIFINSSEIWTQIFIFLIFIVLYECLILIQLIKLSNSFSLN